MKICRKCSHFVLVKTLFNYKHNTGQPKLVALWLQISWMEMKGLSRRKSLLWRTLKCTASSETVQHQGAVLWETISGNLLHIKCGNLILWLCKKKKKKVAVQQKVESSSNYFLYVQLRGRSLNQSILLTLVRQLRFDLWLDTSNHIRRRTRKGTSLPFRCTR